MDVTGLFVCAVATMMAYFQILSPLMQIRYVNAQQVEQSDYEQRECEALYQSRMALDIMLENARKEVNHSTLQLLPATHINHRIADVSILLNDLGLTIDRIQHEPPIQGKTFQIVPITVTGQGPFADCMAFLDAANKELTDIVFTDYTFSGSGNERHDVTAFELRLFWFAASEQHVVGP